MATVSVDGTTLHFRRAGKGTTITFLSEAGLGAWSWSWQHDPLTGPFETIVFDYPGTGQSDTPSGPYSMSGMVAGVRAILRSSAVETTHLVGVGLGGAIALATARESHRVESLVLVGTSDDPTAMNLERAYAPPTDPQPLRCSLRGLFSEPYLTSNQRTVEEILEWRQRDDASPVGWGAQVGALDTFDPADWLVEIDHPTLVCHGGGDTVVPEAAGRSLAQGLPRGTFRHYPHTGHYLQVERATAFNDELVGFIETNANRS